MNREMNREINLWKTIFYSFWSYLVILFLFGNAILYSADKIGSSILIKEICFWGIITLIIMIEFGSWFSKGTFYAYKRRKKYTLSSDSEVKE